MAKSFTVSAPLVLAKGEKGADVYLYQGASVPDGQSAEWVQRHLDDKMIVEGELVAQPADNPADAPAPEPEPAKPASKPKA